MNYTEIKKTFPSIKACLNKIDDLHSHGKGVADLLADLHAARKSGDQDAIREAVAALAEIGVEASSPPARRRRGR